MNGYLYATTIITRDGALRNYKSSVRNKSHDDMVEENYKNELAVLNINPRRYFEKSRYTGLWPNIAALTKYYDALIVLETFEYKVNYVFIPEHISNEQLQTFKHYYSKSMYDSYTFGDKTIENGRYTVKVIRPNGIEPILDILESKLIKTR